MENKNAKRSKGCFENFPKLMFCDKNKRKTPLSPQENGLQLTGCYVTGSHNTKKNAQLSFGIRKIEHQLWLIVRISMSGHKWETTYDRWAQRTI